MALQNEQHVPCGLQPTDYAMGFQEIADTMGLQRQTVWTIYQRGLRKLRKAHPGILGMLREAALELDANRRNDQGEN